MCDRGIRNTKNTDLRPSGSLDWFTSTRLPILLVVKEICSSPVHRNVINHFMANSQDLTIFLVWILTNSLRIHHTYRGNSNPNQTTLITRQQLQPEGYQYLFFNLSRQNCRLLLAALMPLPEGSGELFDSDSFSRWGPCCQRRPATSVWSG
jgi:hypothetical protein